MSESGFTGWKDVQDLNTGKKMNSKKQIQKTLILKIL